MDEAADDRPAEPAFVRRAGLDIGVAYDPKPSSPQRDGPDDLFEELDSEATVDSLMEALAAAGHHPRRLGGGRRFLEAVLSHPPELVFNMAEGLHGRGREAQAPAVLDMLRIPYTHSDPVTLGLALDKPLAKRIVSGAGVATPKWRVAGGGACGALAEGLSFPMIVKPAAEGSSIGIRGAVCFDEARLEAEIARVLIAYRQPALIEEFCPGAEVTVGILGNGGAARVLGSMEIAPRATGAEPFVYSVEVKRDYLNRVDYHTPPRLPAGLVREIDDAALSAYRALACRDVARIDMRLDAAGRPQFLEANPLPGLNPETADLCILARGYGVDYRTLIAGIIDAALRRQQDG